MARKKGGQKLKDLSKRKPKIKVDLTPHYRTPLPSRGKRTGGPRVISPSRPPDEIIRSPGPFGPPDNEGRLRPRKRNLPPVIVPSTKRLGIQPKQFGARIPRGAKSSEIDTSMLLSPFGAAAEIKSRRKGPRK